MSDSNDTADELNDDEVLPFEPVATVNVTAAVDAVYKLGDGRSIKVKTSASGIRLSYTKRVKGYYSSRPTPTTEGVTFPIQFLGYLTELLNEVAAKSEVTK